MPLVPIRSHLYLRIHEYDSLSMTDQYYIIFKKKLSIAEYDELV